MRSSRSTSSLGRFFAILLALHVLNFSIDSQDAHPDFVPEDLHYNDIESIAEFVVEVVLGIDNAIFEYDEADDEQSSEAGFSVFYCNPTSDRLNNLHSIALLKDYSLMREIPYISNVPDIQSPPPKQV